MRDSNSLFNSLISPFIIAHRGASAYQAENTLLAMQEAIQRGATMLEFDVQLAQCGTPMVFHDDDFLLFNGENTSIADYTLAELEQLKPSLSSKRFIANGICSLKTVLSAVKTMPINIELKPADNALALIDAVMSVIETVSFAHEKIIFSSFDIDVLILLHQKYPFAHIAVLFDNWEDFHQHKEKARDLKPCAINVNAHMLTETKRLDSLREVAPDVCCYTVNEKLQAEQLFALGVSAVFSDYPDLLV